MRIEEEIQYYAEILGRENPAVRKALIRLSANPKEAPSVRDQFMLMLKRAGYDVTDLPAFPVNIAQNPTDGVVLGNAVLGNKTGGEVVLGMECFKTPMLIAGITGSGKTTLMMWIAEQLQRK
jgi:ABC-type multidrug transport system fused ATPase/permease subunit